MYVVVEGCQGGGKVTEHPDFEDSTFNENPVVQNEAAEIDTRKLLAERIAIVAGALALCFSLIATINFAGSSSSSSALSDLLSSSSALSGNDASTAADTSWVPSGFTVWSGNPNIAWRWAKSNTFTCSNGVGCIEAEFLSQNGCPSGLYAAINWLDAPPDQNGSVVSYANATLPSLLAMQVAKLRFDDIEGISKSGQMAEIRCS